MGADVFHAQVRQVVERRAEADGRGNVRSPCLELVRHVVVSRVAQMDLADHLAATHERRHFLEDLAPAPQRT